MLLHHAEAFEKAKCLVNKDSCSRFYDFDRPVYVETDASKVGLGAPSLLP